MSHKRASEAGKFVDPDVLDVRWAGSVYQLNVDCGGLRGTDRCDWHLGRPRAKHRVYIRVRQIGAAAVTGCRGTDTRVFYKCEYCRLFANLGQNTMELSLVPVPVGYEIIHFVGNGDVVSAAIR